ncbi:MULTISPECIES: hypothetical protein [Citrobacter]|nr:MULTISPECIES: hypothetical protein [Citrobacter]KAA0559327.1 hypothetical protein F0327_00675 [Citrobacter braakii]MBM3066709.1 hypothetical protein [Citrobacter braakii]WBU73078.1 hypothetical protein PGH06_23570 [Citrobacter braakii]WIF75391.1 hypothetical protein QN090_16215 [Citrobacter braakii]WOI82837.1 hypothetical protein R0Q77_07870 [Citrobacter braakii]
MSKTSENFRQIILMEYAIASLMIVEALKPNGTSQLTFALTKVWFRDACSQQFIQTCRNRNGMEKDAQCKTPGPLSPYTKR